MERPTPEQIAARAKAMLAYLSGIQEKNYDVRTAAIGDSRDHPNNPLIEFALSRQEGKTLPDDVRKIFPVPRERQQHARRYEATLVLPADPKGTTVILFLKPIVGNHSEDSMSYALALHAAASQMDWVKSKLEARKKPPQTQPVLP